MTTKMTAKPRPVLHSISALALLAAGAYLTVELKEEEQGRTPPVPSLAESGRETPLVSRGAAGEETRQSWQRLRNPDRSVLRGEDGAVLATFTDGARTATLKGPSRTFTDPDHTSARVVTTDWLRLLPRPWKPGAERARWFAPWLEEHLGSQKDDLFAYAFQYVGGAPVRKGPGGTPYAGDAGYGPVAADRGRAQRQPDFPDYLGVPHTFADGTTARPEPRRHRALDSSGYLRIVLGHRGRYPLASSDGGGGGLPRTVDAMARAPLGADVVPRPADGGRPDSVDALQPGDLVFFEVGGSEGGHLNHAGLYLGQDTEGHKVFISSRAEADGPTMGDTGGASRLNGTGLYAEAFRAAKRL